MDIELPELPSTLPPGKTWTWSPRDAAWVRIYHLDYFTPSALHRRAYGPQHRFDHHTPPFDKAAICPDRRAITYIANGLRAAASEVFGDLETFGVCPQWRRAWLRPVAQIEVQDLVGPGAMQIKGGSWLGTGRAPREYTQRWARKIYDDARTVQGIRYTGSHEEGRCIALWERAPGLEIVQENGRDCEAAVIEPVAWSEILLEYTETGHSLARISHADCDYCARAANAERESTARAV